MGSKLIPQKIFHGPAKFSKFLKFIKPKNFFFSFFTGKLRCWLSFNLQTLQNLPFTICWIVIYNLVLHIMTWPYYYFPRSRKRKKNAVILEGQHCYGLQMLKAAGRLGGLSFHRYFSNNILEKFGSSKIFHEIISKRYLFFQNVYLCSKRHIVKKYKPHPCVIYKTLTTPQENCVTFWPFFRKKRGHTTYCIHADYSIVASNCRIHQ